MHMPESPFKLILALALTGLLLSTGLEAREPFKDPEELVPVELATVAVDPFTGSPLVLLREPGSGDVVPINIGTAEARAILVALQEVAMPRPMTHDLALDIIVATGGRLERVLVDALIDNTYFGLLDLRMEGREGEPLWVDSRPSDALALAVRSGAKILVSPDVLQATRGLEFEGLPDEQVVTALGITVSEITEDLRRALDLPDEPGVLVNRAIGEAAEAGIAPGAMILEVNGEAPASPMEFLELIRRTGADEKARIRFLHEGEEHEIELSTDVPLPEPEDRGRTRDRGLEV